MKTNKNLFFVHNIFAITTKKNLFLFVFTCFFLFFLRPPKAYNETPAIKKNRFLR